MHVVLYKEEPKSREILAFALESKLGASVSRAAKFEDVVQVLLANNPVDLIICDSKPENATLYKMLLSTGSNIPVLLLLNSTSPQQQNISFPDIKILAGINLDGEPGMEKVIEIIRNEVKNGNLKPTTDDPDYCRVSAELAIQVSPLQGDLYIRLSNTKHIKLFKKGEQLNKTHIEQVLTEKKIKFLFVHRSDYGSFLLKFGEDLKKIADSPTATLQEKEMLSLSAIQVLHELSHKIGFTEEVHELARESVRLVVTTLSKDFKLVNVLKAFAKDRDKYIASHSLMVAHVACGISTKMTWPSDTTSQKLVTAAICHDLSINNQELAKIRTLKELNNNTTSYTPEEITAYKSHPYTSADSLSQANDISSDVDFIIRQHHERPDGSGFPRGLNARNIAPLAAVFIVAHDIVDFICQQGTDNPSFDNFVAEYFSQYSSGIFKRILVAITPELTKNRAA